jgi:CarD family transcriptional regulator
MSAEIKNISSFQINQKVVYPAHGLGVIVGVETKTVHNQKFYKIFFEQENLHSFIPVAKAKELGLRKLCSEDIIKRVLKVLSKPSRARRGMWSRRAQEYDAKIHSGSILLTAEVVRDLFLNASDPNRSYSERTIYENAFLRVATELAATQKISIEQAEEKMNECLCISSKSVVKKEIALESDDFDDDLEEFDDHSGEDEEMAA